MVKPVIVPETGWSAISDDAAGWVYTQQTYDWKGRPLRTINQDSTYKEVSYVGCGCAGGEVVTLTDEVGRQQRVYADVLGRQVKTEVLNWPDQYGNRSVYSTAESLLNARDQAYAVRQFQGADTSGVYTEATTTYDGYGRVATHKLPQQSTATIYEYNADDTLRKVTDPRGVEATNTYNGRHLLTGVSYDPRNSGVNQLPTISFEYDAAGNKTLITDGTGHTSFGYDQLSRVTSESHYIGDLGVSYNLSYGYNLSGELSSVTDPANAQVNYTYDSAGRLTSMPATGYSGVTNFLSNAQYRAFGALKHATYGNSVQLNLTYNSRMQIGQHQLGSGSFTTGATMSYYNDGRTNTAFDLSDSRFDRKYDFDFAARLKEAYSGVEAHGQPAPPMNQANSPYRQSYSYDEWNNVTGRTARIWTQADLFSAYSYSDAAGNILGNNDGNYTYDAAGRPATYVSAQPWQVWPNWPSGHPDAPALETSDTFDGAGQVVKHVDHTRHDDSYDYYGDGNVFYTMSDTTTITYYIHSAVLGGKTIAELDHNGAKKTGYVYSGGARIATQTIAGNSQSIQIESTNPVAGAVTTTDANGSYAGREEPDPLGRDLTTPPDTSNPLALTDPLASTKREPMPVEYTGGPSQDALDGLAAWGALMDEQSRQYHEGYFDKGGYYDIKNQFINALVNKDFTKAEQILTKNPNFEISINGKMTAGMDAADALETAMLNLPGVKAMLGTNSDISDRRFAHAPQNTLPNDLKRQVQDVVANCADYMNHFLSQLGSNYTAGTFGDLYDRVGTKHITIDHKEFERLNRPTAAGLAEDGPRRIFINIGVTAIARVTTFELLHHARDSGVYSDENLDRAAISLMTPWKQLGAQLDMKGTKGHPYQPSTIAHRELNNKCFNVRRQ